MRSASSAFVQKKNQMHVTDPFIWLFEIVIDDTESVRIARYQTNVTFDGDTYYAVAFDIGPLTESAEGKTPTITVTVQNVTLEGQALLDSYSGLVGHKAWLRLVNADMLGDGEAMVEVSMKIQATNSGAEVIQFQLGRADLFQRMAPKGRFMRDYCQWTYGGEECRFPLTDSLPTCDHTLAGSNGCRVHGDLAVANGFKRKWPQYFGAYPGILRERN